MERYWKAQLRAPKPTTMLSAATSPRNAMAGSMQLEYECHHQMLLIQEEDEGWQGEL